MQNFYTGFSQNSTQLNSCNGTQNAEKPIFQQPVHLQKSNTSNLYQREQFAISLRQKKKKEILTLKRRHMAQVRCKTSSNQNEAQQAQPQSSHNQQSQNMQPIPIKSPENLKTSFDRLQQMIEENKVDLDVAQRTLAGIHQVAECTYNESENVLVRLLHENERHYIILLRFLEAFCPYKSNGLFVRGPELELRIQILQVLTCICHGEGTGSLFMTHYYDQVVKVFRDNFQMAKEYCEKTRECPPEMKEDILLLINLLNVISADHTDIVKCTIKEGFDSLLVELYKAIPQDASEKSQQDMVGKDLQVSINFSHFLIICSQEPELTEMCHSSLVGYVLHVFKDQEIAQQCTNDFFNSVVLNKARQQTDGDSTQSDDDPNTDQITNQTEQLRHDLINIILQAYNVDHYHKDESTVEKYRELLSQISKQVITFLAKEMCLFDYRTLKTCLMALVQITGSMPPSVCSFLLEKNGILATLDKVLRDGPLKYKEKALILLCNLSVNSIDETLKIISNQGLLKRILMTIEQNHDGINANEALTCLYSLTQQITRKQEQIDEAILGFLFFEVKTDEDRNMIQVISSKLAKSKTQRDAENAQLTIQVLDQAFNSCLKDEIQLEFEKCAGLDNLEQLQYSIFPKVLNAAQDFLLKWYDIEECEREAIEPTNQKEESTQKKAKYII